MALPRSGATLRMLSASRSTSREALAASVIQAIAQSPDHAIPGRKYASDARPSQIVASALGMGDATRTLCVAVMCGVKITVCGSAAGG
jgi:hypothetical protein